MSTLQVANVHLESTGNNRIQYAGSNSFNIVAGGSNTLTVNSTALNVNAALNVNGSLLLNSSLLIPTVNVQTFDSSGTWTKPSGNYRQYKVQLWGGGGAGAKGASAAARSGGGGGGYWEYTGFMYELGATETVTVGTGGPAQTVAGTSGANGGSSSFTRANSTTLTVSGGEGGQTGEGGGGGTGGSIFGLLSRSAIPNNFDYPFIGFTSPEAGYGGLVLVPEQISANASAEITTWTEGGRGIWGGGGGGGYLDGEGGGGGDGGGSIYGGGGGGSGYEVVGDGPRLGGVSIFGGNGGAGGYDSVAGSNGSVPGGGGGGSEIANSGAGANGRVIVISW